MTQSQKHRNSPAIHGFYHQPMKEEDSYSLSQIELLDNNMFSIVGSQGAPSISFQTYKDEYFTLESSTTTTGFVYDSPAGSVSSSRSPFSPQGSHSCLTDPHHSPETTYGSPVSGSSSADKLREMEMSLLGPESEMKGSHNFCFANESKIANSLERLDANQIAEMIPRLDLKQVLIGCAQAIDVIDIGKAAGLMHVLEQMVSVSGEPIQRVGAYMLEGLRARLELSGSKIYRALKCDAPISSDLMTYMGILYQICPYWKFAYMSANVVIQEAVQYERRIHIIDFQIAQGSQWVPLIQSFAKRPGGAPVIRITGIDDSQSAHARGGGLHIVGERLSKVAAECNVAFEFHDTAMDGCEIQREHLNVRPGEAVVVNFPYVLHHMPDESVDTWNHRDRLLRLVKSLSPKIVTLVEQESNTNTTPFHLRFLETLSYYTAMFESIDVARPRDDRQRISAEQHCVARDIVNVIACEGAERVERHELLGKWRSRFQMAGFSQYPLSSSVTAAVRDVLKDYDRKYRVEERDGGLCLYWLRRAMAASSAWM
ncbi:Scarecrow-like protein 13 [Linum perenne]